MGLYIHKSFSFGPLRLNLSKSGLGYSFGAKDERADTGASCELQKSTHRQQVTVDTPDVCTAMRSHGRILLIDLIRGLLILLMGSSHAIALTGLSMGSFWLSKYWLPRGWATEGFIALSGVAAALAFDWNLKPKAAQRALIRRSGQLLIVMFISNVVLLITKYLITDETYHLLDIRWWTGLLTFQTEYSISGVLLPTAVMLLVLPFVNVLTLRFGLIYGFLVVILFLSAVEVALQRGSLEIRSILLFGAGFPIIPMVCIGILAFCVGLAANRIDLQIKTVLTSAFLATGLLFLIRYVQSPYLRALMVAGTPILRIIVLGAIGILILLVPTSQDWKGVFGIIGRYSLLCFIGHRVIMHAVFLIGRQLLLLPPEALYVWSMAVTFSSLIFLCRYRAKSPTFDSACRLMYL